MCTFEYLLVTAEYVFVSCCSGGAFMYPNLSIRIEEYYSIILRGGYRLRHMTSLMHAKHLRGVRGNEIVNFARWQIVP